MQHNDRPVECSAAYLTLFWNSLQVSLTSDLDNLKLQSKDDASSNFH